MKDCGALFARALAGRYLTGWRLVGRGSSFSSPIAGVSKSGEGAVWLFFAVELQAEELGPREGAIGGTAWRP